MRSPRGVFRNEAIRSKERLFQESGHANPRLHPREQVRQRPDQPFAWHDEGSESVDPKTGWRYDTKPSSSSSSSEWQPSSWWQSSAWSEKSRSSERHFIGTKNCVPLTGNGDSLVSDGRCKHCTQPTHTPHSRTRDFSRLAQDSSHRVNIFIVSHKTVILHV